MVNNLKVKDNMANRRSWKGEGKGEKEGVLMQLSSPGSHTENDGTTRRH